MQGIFYTENYFGSYNKILGVLFYLKRLLMLLKVCNYLVVLFGTAYVSEFSEMRLQTLLTDKTPHKIFWKLVRIWTLKALLHLHRTEKTLRFVNRNEIFHLLKIYKSDMSRGFGTPKYLPKYRILVPIFLEDQIYFSRNLACE